MSSPWFNVRKAAQVAAYFAMRQGKRISILKLVKLVYLADRQSMREFGHPILDDKFVSMPHGPVNSYTYNYINGMFGECPEWSEFVGSRFGNNIGAVGQIDVDDLDELSDADLSALKQVWEDFGGMSPWELRQWTHDNCPEWEDPEGGSEPIPHSRIFKFLGHNDGEELADDIQQKRSIDEIFAALRQ